MISGTRLSSVSVFFGCLIVLVLGLLNPASAEEPAEIVNDASIKSMTERAGPLIEELTGRMYKSSVEFKLVKRDVVRDVLTEELLPQLNKLLKGAAPDMISRQAETSAHMMSQVVLGKYSYLKKALYLIPDNVKSQVEMLEIKDEDLEDFAFLVVAHEMVHALDDQHFDLQKSLETRDSAEKMQAFNAFTEGHAVYVSERVADRLKLSEMAQKLSVKSAAGITDENNRMQQQVFHNIYVLGSKFVEAIIDSKGPSIIAKAFAAPPASTRHIMHPAEYLDPSITDSLDCVALLQRVTGEFPIEEMRSQSIDVGPMTMRTILVSQGISEKEAIDISDDFISGALMSAAKPTLKPSTVTVFILNFVSRDAVAKFGELMKRVEQSGEAQFNARLNASYNVINEEKLKLDGYDSATYRHVETTVDEDVNTAISADGSIGTIYVSLTFSNMKDKVTRQKVLKILESIEEQSRMKTASEVVTVK